VGSTTIYAHLQAIGLVNDHLRSCFRWRELSTASGGAPSGPSPGSLGHH
jgi:hypothetical protein